jgi:Domain of unknown function (DUF6484)
MKTEMLLDDVPSTTLSRSVQKLERGRSRRETTRTRAAPKIVGVLIGRLVDLGESGEPLVDFPGNASTKPLAALSILVLGKGTVGREVVLMFEEGDPRRPVVMGFVEDRGAKRRQPVELLLDKKRFVFTAEHEIVLRCGKASITLTRAGKVLIRGAYLLNRSSGVNRIKGGSVQIN